LRVRSQSPFSAHCHIVEEENMSRSVSCIAIGVVAFVAGVLSSRLANFAEEGKPGAAEANVEKAAGAANAASREFTIEGMSCQGCADSITSALTAIPGVQSATVSLREKRAVVVADERQAPTAKILSAIAAAGYQGQAASAVGGASAATAAAAGKPPILVNITRGKAQLHAVSMALGIAQSAIKDGRSAVVFLNVESPIFAAKDADKDLRYADFPPISKMLADFMAMGGRVLVCGHCAHIAKLGQKDMIDGAKLIGHHELFAAVPSATAVFSY
jgi:copper chaperone